MMDPAAVDAPKETSCVCDHDDENLTQSMPCPKTTSTSTPDPPPHRYRFVATGLVANARLSPLLPAEWVDITSTTSSSRHALQTKTVNTSSSAATATATATCPPNNNNKVVPDFLWENAPRHETKEIRDRVRVYSHLPNGINILDSKWVLGRLFANHHNDHHTNNDEETTTGSHRNPLLATCETHCFSGLEGFHDFGRSVKLFAGSEPESQTGPNGSPNRRRRRQELSEILSNLPDIGPSAPPPSTSRNPIHLQRPPLDTMNWWVVKDAGANGAGGVWVVGSENAKSFGSPGKSPLLPDHKYVAQQYVWPPVLYEGKKSHVRVYVTVTCDGRAFVHRRAFLHVANDPFALDTSNQADASTSSSSDSDGNDHNAFDDQIHITNCCANSHDDTKFAGEILADFGATRYTTWTDADGHHSQPVVPLAAFFPSVQATVSEVVRRTFRLGLLDGGQANRGFEYCGMDFMLSYQPSSSSNEAQLPPSSCEEASSPHQSVQPVAYLLEINSPPSQDTASSLPHAEDLHNAVLRDWMTFWVIPHIDPTHPVRAGGWMECPVVHHNNTQRSTPPTAPDKKAATEQAMVAPSKAAMLNKIRWALFERKVQKQESSLRRMMQGKKDGNPAKLDTDVGNEKGTQQRKCDDGIDSDDNNDNNDNNDDDDSNSPSAIQFSRFARSQFPFFSTPSRFTDDDHDNDANGPQQQPQRNSSSASSQGVVVSQQQQQQQIFFENAGGAQVPQAVIDRVTGSLTRRHRETIGSDTKAAARETLRRLLVGGTEERTEASSVVIVGLNATSLLVALAQRYAQLLTATDEVVLSTENHLANFDPWIQAAKSAGATIKLWAPYQGPFGGGDKDSVPYESSSHLMELVTPHTRIVALPHASNVLGSVRPISDLSAHIKEGSRGYAHIVVDGVAVAPHDYVGFDEASFGPHVDWYVVSMHKLFGPHIGVLLARQNRCLQDLLASADASFPASKPRDERIQSLLESGTANIEGCAGVVGLGMYWKSLAQWCQRTMAHSGRAGVEKPMTNGTAEMISIREAKLAYKMIRKVESALVRLLLRGLSRCPDVRVLDGSTLPGSFHNNGRGHDDDQLRLPVVSFVHKRIPSREIYTYCHERGIVCRNGLFLCTPYLAADWNLTDPDGALRVSLAHYNTPQEVQILCNALERMPNWLDTDQNTTNNL